MNIKRIILLLSVLLSGLIMVPAANADVVVKYIVVNDGHSYHEPMRNRHGSSRLYSGNSHYRNHSYSNRSGYQDRRHYSEPRRYRNTYYYKHRNHDGNYRSHGRDANDRRSSLHSREKLHKGYFHDAPRDNHHRYDRSYRHQDKKQGGRVHINVK